METNGHHHHGNVKISSNMLLTGFCLLLLALGGWVTDRVAEHDRLYAELVGQQKVYEERIERLEEDKRRQDEDIKVLRTRQERLWERRR